MKLGIITIGSQGDIDPFIALGKRLKERGHHVRIAAFDMFENYIRAEGFEYAPLAGDAVEVIRLLIGEQVSPSEYFHNLDALLNPVKGEFLADVVSACEGTDAILYSLLGSVAWHVADRLNIPCFRAFFFPADPTWEFPAMTAPVLPLGPVYNRFTFACGDYLWTQATRRLLNDWRKALGLPPIRPFSFPYRKLHGKPIPTLYAYSSMVSPKPTTWDENRYITGYWVFNTHSDWKPDKSLVDFLRAGDPPIYIGFGSAVGGSFEELFQIIDQSLRETGQRAVLSSGWGNLHKENMADYIYQVGFVPHEWLFQHTSAVIHHGGAGTTATGLRAGCPTLVVPFGGDQLYWGNRVWQLGVGAKPIPRNSLNARRLSMAISEMVNNHAMMAKAGLLGQKLQAEDGVGNAVEFIEQVLHR